MNRTRLFSKLNRINSKINNFSIDNLPKFDYQKGSYACYVNSFGKPQEVIDILKKYGITPQVHEDHGYKDLFISYSDLYKLINKGIVKKYDLGPTGESYVGDGLHIDRIYLE